MWCSYLVSVIVYSEYLEIYLKKHFDIKLNIFMVEDLKSKLEDPNFFDFIQDFHIYDLP